MKEIWKDIAGYEKMYQVSSIGRVKSLPRIIFRKGKKCHYKERVLKPNNSFGLYLMVAISKNGKQKLCSIHRLVANAFIPNPENKREVNHIDGNKHNNRVSNLEWVTRKENTLHSIKIGLQTKEQIAKSVASMKAKNQKPILQLKNGIVIARFPSVRAAGRELNFCNWLLCKCANGKCKMAYGYEWRYDL